MKRPQARYTTVFLKRLGPGLITGASDDDPSGIGTCSQAGAQLFRYRLDHAADLPADGRHPGNLLTDRSRHGSRRLFRAGTLCWSRSSAELHAVDPIKALYWSAVMNGVLAAPVMADADAAGQKPESYGPLGRVSMVCALGWASAVAMAPLHRGDARQPVFDLRPGPRGRKE